MDGLRTLHTKVQFDGVREPVDCCNKWGHGLPSLLTKATVDEVRETVKCYAVVMD